MARKRLSKPAEGAPVEGGIRTPERGVPSSPAGRRVLAECSLSVKSAEHLEIEVDLEGVSTLDPVRDNKSSILAVFWTDREGTLLDFRVRHFFHSDTFGDFVYVGPDWGDSISRAVVNLRAPKGAAHLVVRFMPFANPTVRLLAITVRKLATE